MSAAYRKWGRSVRREGANQISIDEAGEAVEIDGVFRASSLEQTMNLPAPDGAGVAAVARELESMVNAPLVVERMIVSDGIVQHEMLPVSGSRLPEPRTGHRPPATGHIRWREHSRRIHLSIARPPLRALIDLASFDVALIRPVVEALQRAGRERPAPKRMRLAENVGAALLPIADVPKVQSAASHDGIGQPIEERPVTRGAPPNWYRPTYRLPPRRVWFHLRALPAGEIDGGAPVAVALLAPVQKGLVRVLCVDGDAAFPATVEVSRVIAVRPTPAWYPYAAGAFGAEMLL